MANITDQREKQARNVCPFIPRIVFFCHQNYPGSKPLYDDLKQTKPDQGGPSHTMADHGRARYSRVQPGTKKGGESVQKIVPAKYSQDGLFIEKQFI